MVILHNSSDKWIIQGGKYTGGATSCTITFHKPMKDLNYHIELTDGRDSAESDTDGVDFNVYQHTLTASSIKCSNVSGRNIFWQICGYID